MAGWAPGREWKQAMAAVIDGICMIAEVPRLQDYDCMLRIKIQKRLCMGAVQLASAQARTQASL